MSWTTGSQTEALSANAAVGTAFNTFTSAQYIGPDPSASGYLPANFFLSSYGRSKAIFVKAYGVVSTTGTPTFNIGVSGNTTQGTYNSSGVFGQINSGSPITMPSSVTNIPWDLELLISCVTTGSSGTFLSDGMFRMYTAATTTANYRVSSSTANPNTAATVSTQSAYYLELFATWGTSNASNSIQCYQIATLGLN